MPSTAFSTRPIQTAELTRTRYTAVDFAWFLLPAILAASVASFAVQLVNWLADTSISAGVSMTIGVLPGLVSHSGPSAGYAQIPRNLKPFCYIFDLGDEKTLLLIPPHDVSPLQSTPH